MRLTTLTLLGILSAVVPGDSVIEPAPRAVSQATPPWHFEIGSRAGGATGPIVADGNLAYVGRGSVIAVANLGAPGGPVWIGQSEALAAPVTHLALWDGHLYGLVGDDGRDEDLVVLSLAEPTAPMKVGGWDLGGASADLAVDEGRAWISVLSTRDGGQMGATIVGLDLGDAGRPVEWASISVPQFGGAGDGDPPRTPVVQALGRWLLVGQDGPEESWLGAQVRSLGIHPGWQPTWRWNLPGEGQTIMAMTADGPARRVYAISAGYYVNRLLVADLLPDGRLERRASLILSEAAMVDCPGRLTHHGRWLLYATGCPNGGSAVFDLRDPDAPVEVIGPDQGMPIASFASAGDRLVAGTGDSGELLVLETDALPELRVQGRTPGMPMFRSVVEIPSGRYALADGLGIVRLDDIASELLGPPELVLAVPKIRLLAAGPGDSLVVVENLTTPGGPSSLWLVTPGPAGLRVTDRREVGPVTVATLRVSGDDLYLASQWTGTIQRWRMGADGLERQAVSDELDTSVCFAVGDAVYVRTGDSLTLLDRLSLVTQQAMAHGSSEGCGIAIRSVAGRTGADDITLVSSDEVVRLRREAGAMRTLKRAKFSGIGAVRDLEILDGQVLALGSAGIVLVSTPEQGAWHAQAHLPLREPLDAAPVKPGSTELVPGTDWLVTMADRTMLRMGVAKGQAPPTAPPDPELNRPIAEEPDPDPWPTADLERGGNVAFLPDVARGSLGRRAESKRPAPFTETRTLGHRFGALAVESDERRLWAADGYAVVGLDLATEQLDEVARSAELPDAIRHLAVDGDLLLATGTDQRLHVLSRPATGDPALLGSLALPDVAEGLVARGGVAYVATSLAGILTVDLSRPAWPRIVHRLEALAPSMGLEGLDGGLLWLGQGFSGPGTRQAAVISLADPARPAWGPDLPGSFQNHAHYAACGSDLFAYNHELVAGRMEPGLQVTELPDWAVELRNLAPGFGSEFLRGMACSNRRLAVYGEH